MIKVSGFRGKAGQGAAGALVVALGLTLATGAGLAHVATAAAATQRPQDSLASQLAAAQRKVAAAEADLQALTRQTDDLARRIRDLQARRDVTVAVLSARVGAAYRLSAPDGTFVAVLAGADFLEMADGLVKLDHINEDDAVEASEAQKLDDRLQEESAKLDLVRNQQQSQVAALADRRDAVARLLAVENAAQELAQASTGIDLVAPLNSGGDVRPAAANGMVCPLAPPFHFADTYGASRSGGRSHKGVDMFAAGGAPEFAVESGTVTRSRSNPLGGLYVWLVGDSGNAYYYAHNSANVVTAGTRVSAGQVLARVGNTGDAAGLPTHLHFEVHPSGGAATNPTPFVAGLCS